MIFKQVIIDTLELTVAVGSVAAYNFLSSALKTWAQDSISNKKTKLVPEKYGLRLNYLSEKKCCVAFLQLGITKTKHKYARLSIQVGSMSLSEFSGFQADLEKHVPMLSYAKLFYSANVSRIDFAVDLIGLNALEIIPYRPKVARSNFYLRKDGSRGTLYLGGYASKVLVRIYDRKRKLKRKGICLGFEKCTRIEVQTRRLGEPASKLHSNFANPFAGLIVAKLKDAREVAVEHWWQKFLDVAEHIGSAKALTMLPKNRRSQARARLKAAQATWWKPEGIWQAASMAIKKIHPQASCL